MKTIIYWILLAALINCTIVPWVLGKDEEDEPESLLKTLDPGAAKSAHLQSIVGQRRPHGIIYFIGH
ncbi:unnamed protein product [Allacma fusca]|uniref:Uncharacterized protein n=1 Tax=Allacma fusca TaxID=39272 RepID=A0A8J2PE65_9HEXA|nr:unnamed protein product [Allacma fusca]